MIIDGVEVTRKDNVLIFKYKDVPVNITIVPCISDEDIIELVRSEMLDMDRLFQDL